jgi:hypothetical protein
MFRSSSFYHYSHNHVTTSFKSFFFFIPTTLALLTSLFILFYVYSTSIIFTHHHHHHHHKFQPILHLKSSSSSNFTLPSPTNKNDSEFIKSHTFQLDDHIHGLGPQSQQGLSHDQSSLKGMQKFQVFNISINNIIC